MDLSRFAKLPERGFTAVFACAIIPPTDQERRKAGENRFCSYIVPPLAGLSKEVSVMTKDCRISKVAPATGNTASARYSVREGIGMTLMVSFAPLMVMALCLVAFAR